MNFNVIYIIYQLHATVHPSEQEMTLSTDTVSGLVIRLSGVIEIYVVVLTEICVKSDVSIQISVESNPFEVEKSLTTL